MQKINFIHSKGNRNVYVTAMCDIIKLIQKAIFMIFHIQKETQLLKSVRASFFSTIIGL